MQILLAKRLGKKRIIAETGAGQHGVATATVCARFGFECVIYMGAEDVRRQALNVFRIKMLGGKVCYIRVFICQHLIVPLMHRWFQLHPAPTRSKMLSMRRCGIG